MNHLTEKQKTFLRQRIYCGRHLSGEIIDGLKRISENYFVNLEKQEMDALFTNLLILEKQADVPKNEEHYVTTVSRVKTLVSYYCGWI